MRCPQCNQEDLDPYGSCARCGFSGAPGRVEELGHVAYLLGEIDTWTEVPLKPRDQLRGRYLRRRAALEQALGVRQPSLGPEQIRAFRWQLVCLRQLQDEVDFWLGQGWIESGPAARMSTAAAAKAEALETRLAAAPAAPDAAPEAFTAPRARLAIIDYLEQALRQARRSGDLTGEEAYRAALADLEADREEAEIEAGLRVRPAAPAPEAAAEPRSEVQAAPPRKPREPLTREKLWQTLLSERTLNVLLFLGAFLLIASATTYVIANWETLPPWAQLAFIVLLTLSFYAAGWFLRVRMGLRASGIAITAVGSLVVPLDFYAVFVAGGYWPAERWPWVWLMAAAVCLPIYTFTAFRIRAPFFGYLVAVAAGNLLCAGLRVAGIGSEWWLVALVGLAWALAAWAYRYRSNLLSAPFRFAALVATAAILPLGVGWWLALGVAGTEFDVSLAGSWLLGAALLAFAAAREQSALLGRAAAVALPGAVLLLLRIPFRPLGVEPPWYALAWAILGPAYLVVGRRWLAGRPARALGRTEGAATPGEGDAFLRAHGATLTGLGLALMIAAAVWAVFDLGSAAATHAVLAAGAALAIRAWDRPRALPVVSVLAVSAATFAMAAAHLEPAELAIGWALLAVLHVAVAVGLRAAPGGAPYTAPLFAAAFPLAGLAVAGPLALGHEPLLTYALGNWIGLAVWGLWLDHSRAHAGLDAVLDRLGRLRASILHWAIAAPLPFFAGLVYARLRPPDGWLGPVLALVAWGCFVVAYWPRLARRPPADRSEASDPVWWRPSFPWKLAAAACSLAAPAAALYYHDRPLLAVALLMAAELYFGMAWLSRRGEWLAAGGLALPAGLAILLRYWQVGWAELSVALAAIAAVYLLGGLWLEKKRGLPASFVNYLYGAGHVVAVAAVAAGLAPALESRWSDPAKLWAAGGELVLAGVYAVLAWFDRREAWSHTAVWLSVLAGGLVALAYGQGRGSSAFKVAALAVAYILVERGLAWRAARAWPLYRRALLIAGWAVSGGAIALALGRNLVLLGGGRTREMWAIAGLTTVTALYAASAWMFRRRLFLWLAGGLIVLPWTLLTAWGWFVFAAPARPAHYAPALGVLAGVELLAGIFLTPSLWTGRVQKGEYGFPLRVWANLILALALAWGLADAGTSCLTFEMGIIFYVLSALVDHWRGLAGWRAARFLYPAVALLPAWAGLLLARTLPTAPYELLGLLLLALALPLLGAGRALRRVRADDALPLYLGAYAVAAAGTLLVASQRPLAAVALTFDLLLCVLSVYVFREPRWAYPAAALAPAALLLALAESAVPPDRRGWPLIALGAAYLAVAWLLRRAKKPEFAVPPLAAAFAVVALGLPPSSLDDVGAFWGYLAAALIYAAAAAWLRQPLLLTPALALLTVPYGVAVANLPLARADYGLAIFPGVAALLVLAHALDARLGRRQPSIPGLDPRTWRLSALLDWWAAPAYGGAYLAALAAVGLSWPSDWRLAIALVLAAAAFLHAAWRFRQRGALLVALGLAQGAAAALLHFAGWWSHRGRAALGFLPVTLATAALGLAVEWRRREGSPLGGQWWAGWSRPFTLLLAIDLLAGQRAALLAPAAQPGAVVTLAHAALLAVLATAWTSGLLAPLAAALGIAGVLQALVHAHAPVTAYPVALALLALGYGLAGYGLQAVRAYAGWQPGAPAARRVDVWRGPLEWIALGLSLVAVVGALVAGVDVVGLVITALVGWPLDAAAHAAELRMAMWVLALAGLLYLATAASRRQRALAYGAVALLLGSWALWWRFFVDMPQFQWYAVPAGAYLLGIGWLEWRSGNRALARWVDRAGILVWLGSSWWQSLSGLDDSWPCALIMGVEALLLVWWGSARRQKLFLYVGMMGVILDALTQSVEPLLTVNRWIVLGLAGLLIFGVAVLVERRLDRIRALSAEFRGRLEAWE